MPAEPPTHPGGTVVSARHSQSILLAIAAAALGCTGAETTTSPTIPGRASLLEGHGCSGAAEVVVSAYPKVIAIGEKSTFYASVFDASGEGIPARLVAWSISDTTVASIGGPDENGRLYAVAKRGGTTRAIGNCGGMTAAATITIEGGSAPPDTSTTTGESPARVVVTLNTVSLQPGQTAQAAASGIDAEGMHMSITSVVWHSTNDAVATVTPSGAVTAQAAGSANIEATIVGTTGSAALTVAGTGGPTTPPPTGPVTPPSGLTAAQPQPPQAGVPDARFVAPTGRVIRVGSGGGVQEALNAAQPGDAVVLTAGASYSGNFILPNNGAGSSGSCSNWTTLTTETSLPGEGVRVTPQSAASFAKLVTPNVDAALKTAPGAACWRVVGVEMVVAPSFNGLHYGLVLSGIGDATSTSQLGHGFVFDRVYIHGQSSTNLIRCVALNSIRTAIINSWIADCHSRGFDSQAIAGWTGPGPFLIENNYLEGAGENVMFGGADPRIQGLVPSDITIRRNHFYKPTSWKGVWTVKNLFELKSARRLLIEGNVFENNWADAQTGMAIVLKSANDGGTGPWQGTTDVTFRSNIVRNSPQGLSAAAREANAVVPMARILVQNNLFENIGSFNGSVSGRMLILLNDLRDVTITSNTLIHNISESGQMVMMDGPTARNIIIRDNVATKGGPYGAVMYSGVSIGAPSLAAYSPSSWAFDRNVVIGLDPEFVPQHPQSSFYPASMSAVGFANPGGGDYRLVSGSYKGQATNGGDPGANFDQLNQLTNGVVVR
jgi:hypothetical protein